MKNDTEWVHFLLSKEKKNAMFSLNLLQFKKSVLHCIIINY